MNASSHRNSQARACTTKATVSAAAKAAAGAVGRHAVADAWGWGAGRAMVPHRNGSASSPESQQQGRDGPELRDRGAAVVQPGLRVKLIIQIPCLDEREQ